MAVSASASGAACAAAGPWALAVDRSVRRDHFDAELLERRANLGAVRLVERVEVRPLDEQLDPVDPRRGDPPDDLPV